MLLKRSIIGAGHENASPSVLKTKYKCACKCNRLDTCKKNYDWCWTREWPICSVRLWLPRYCLFHPANKLCNPDHPKLHSVVVTLLSPGNKMFDRMNSWIKRGIKLNGQTMTTQMTISSFQIMPKMPLMLLQCQIIWWAKTYLTFQ